MMEGVGQFLSPEWLRDLAAEAAASPELRKASAGLLLTVRHVVCDGPAGDVEYRVCFADGRVEVQPGDGPADVEIRQDHATAVAIHRGELTPADAFAAGRLRLGGRHGALAEHREAFSRLGDVFSELRARTTY